MTSTKKLIVATALTGLLAGAGTLQAAETSRALKTMKPMHGISFDVGAERAVSFFLSENGHCKLVVTLAGEPNWNDIGSFTVTRFEAAISAGKTTRYISTEGKGFEFACASDAQAVSVTALDQVADHADSAAK